MSRTRTATETMSTTDHRHEHALVIYNGPSRDTFKGLKLSCPVIGCNFAYRDFAVTDLVAIDRLSVAAIRREFAGDQYAFRCWTKPSSLELPPGWQEFPNPGIDSGSLAVALALSMADEVVVIGCDGVLGGSRHTAYEYKWHGNQRNTRIHDRHAQTLMRLRRENPERIHLVWDQEHSETIGISEAIQRLGKYVITEAPDGETRNL